MSLKLFNGDCLDIMNGLADGSVDMVLCDLPYGTTRNTWDTVIPLDKLWAHYNRIVKENGAVVLFAQTPFDKVLGCSNLGNLKYEWIVEKSKATGHLNSKRMPMKAHENILVFYRKQPCYHPQMTHGHPPVHSFTKHTGDGTNYGATKTGICGGGSTDRFPTDVLRFKWDTQKSAIHPTQKPVSLCEYMIKTYTDEGETVLDNCMGSGSTGVACINTGRHFIGIEKEERYFKIAGKRIKEAVLKKEMDLF